MFYVHEEVRGGDVVPLAKTVVSKEMLQIEPSFDKWLPLEVPDPQKHRRSALLTHPSIPPQSLQGRLDVTGKLNVDLTVRPDEDKLGLQASVVCVQALPSFQGLSL